MRFNSVGLTSLLVANENQVNALWETLSRLPCSGPLRPAPVPSEPAGPTPTMPFSRPRAGPGRAKAGPTQTQTSRASQSQISAPGTYYDPCTRQNKPRWWISVPFTFSVISLVLWRTQQCNIFAIDSPQIKLNMLVTSVTENYMYFGWVVVLYCIRSLESWKTRSRVRSLFLTVPDDILRFHGYMLYWHFLGQG